MDLSAAASVPGLVGSALIIFGYFVNQQGWMASSDWRYSAVNLAGAVLILVSLWFEWNLPSVVMEGFWAAISLYALGRRLTRRAAA